MKKKVFLLAAIMIIALNFFVVSEVLACGCGPFYFGQGCKGPGRSCVYIPPN